MRARIDTAVGCFILADQHAVDWHACDAMSIMRTISVHNCRPMLKTIVQLIEPENKQYLISVGIPDHHIVCINELRMSMAAQGCMLPGLTTIITNITNSVAIEPEVFEDARVREYAQGLEHEVYAEPMPPIYYGQPYLEVVGVVFAGGVLLLGLVQAETWQLALP